MTHMQELGEVLDFAITELPTLMPADHAINTPEGLLRPVMRVWTMTMPIRHQGTITAALRGADGAPKDDPSKAVVTMIRRATMNPVDDRETLYAGGFFGFDAKRLRTDTHAFLRSMDQYPLHYITHIMHAAEVIGYKHPSNAIRLYFATLYHFIVAKFHLRPESMADMDLRLMEDRIANNTVAVDYTPQIETGRSFIGTHEIEFPEI